MIACLIPAHNEAPRLPAVLAAVLGHPAISRVLVIDDGSTDGTAEVARAAGASVLELRPNRGKTAALAAGIRAVNEDHLLLIDADLLGLTPDAIMALVDPVSDGRAAVSLSLRGNAPGLWRAIGVDYLTGERLIPRALIAPHLDRLDQLPRFGFEVFLNGLIRQAGLRVAVVRWPAVASPLKSAKHGFWVGIVADLRMMRDIFRTIPPMVALAQIFWLRRGGGSDLRPSRQS